MTDKKKFRAIIQGQADKAYKRFGDALDKYEEGERSDEFYWDGYSDCAKNLLKIIDSMKDEPVSKDFEMALAEMIDKAQKCVVEPLVIAEQWKDYLIELAKSEETVSESIDFEQELYKAFGQIKDFTLGVAIAKRFYDMGKNSQEPVSEDLEEAADCYKDMVTPEDVADYEHAYFYEKYTEYQIADAFKAGAKWQIAKLMAKATKVTVHIDAGGYPYIPQMELYDYDKDVPFAKEGDKYKVVLIKEE